jgi:hypothetical protein
MDALIHAKVSKVLQEPFLNPKVRTGLIFTTITITTRKERNKFNLILNSFLDEIKTNNNKKKGKNNGAFQPYIKESSKKAQAHC